MQACAAAPHALCVSYALTTLLDCKQARGFGSQFYSMGGMPPPMMSPPPMQMMGGPMQPPGFPPMQQPFSPGPMGPYN